jgi:hypothetical protein
VSFIKIKKSSAMGCYCNTSKLCMFSSLDEHLGVS